ncbi:MAG: hypothetical protein ACOC56_06560, partial [Atribacterota bacterium]
GMPEGVGLPEGIGMKGIKVSGNMKMVYEVWEVLAVNSTHLKLKRLTNNTNIRDSQVMVVKNNYDFSYAEDFVK